MSESAGKSNKSPKFQIPLPAWRLFLELSWTGATLAAFFVPKAIKERALGDEPHWYTGWGPTLALYGVVFACIAIYATSRWRLLRDAAGTNRASDRAVLWITLSMVGPLIVGAVFVIADHVSASGVSESPWSIASAFLVAVARWRSEEHLGRQASSAAPEPR
ncbi:hypothetical protein ACTXJJ_06320 [Corynebacterium casei]|uniref:hypothetical protein n=1 Tax=Corynebacterium casei TaxID=160386 RepID=UPI003FB674AC